MGVPKIHPSHCTLAVLKNMVLGIMIHLYNTEIYCAPLNELILFHLPLAAGTVW